MPPHFSHPDNSPPFDIVMPSMIAGTQKQVLRQAAVEIAKTIGIGERILFDRLSEQEKKTPSAMGDGISLLHLQLSGLQDSLCFFARMKNPISMNAPDSQDVDLVCILLTPEREGAAYLRTMARISRLLRNEATCMRLRSAADEKEIRAALDQSTIKNMAA